MLKSKIEGNRLIILKTKNKKSPPAPLPAISGFQIQIRKIRNHGRVSTGFGVAISSVVVGVAVAVSVAGIVISILGIAIAWEPKTSLLSPSSLMLVPTFYSLLPPALTSTSAAEQELT